VKPLELLLLSFRQLRAGPAVLHHRPPKLFTRFWAQPGDEVQADNDQDDEDWGCLIVASEKNKHLPSSGGMTRFSLLELALLQKGKDAWSGLGYHV